jgi:hypothetical protein
MAPRRNPSTGSDATPPTVSAAGRGTTSGAKPDLLAPESQAHWTYTAGHWQVVDGELRQDPQDAHGMLPDAGAAYYDQAFADFELRCKMRMVSWNRGRIVFHSTDSHSGYVAELTTWGVVARPQWNRITLFRRQRGCFPVEIAHAKRIPLKANQWQEVTIACHGSRMEVLLDGEQVLAAEDMAFPAGRFGFETCQDDGTPNYVKEVTVEGRPVDLEWTQFPSLTPYQEHLISHTMEGGGDNSFSSQAQLANGEIVLSHRVAPSHVGLPTEAYPRGGYCVIRRSTDNGLTWSEPVSAVDMGWPMGEFNLHARKDGEIHAYFITYHNWPPDKYYRPVPGYPNLLLGFWRTISEDAGKTWHEPEFLPADHGMVSAHGGWFPFTKLVEMPDGKLVYPAYLITQQTLDQLDNERVTTMWLGFLLSNDGGRTWTSRLVPQDPALSANESSACLLPDGSIFCVARSDIQDSMWQTWSRDAGESWSHLEPIGFEGHSPFALLTSKGVLLVAHRTPGTAIHYSLDYGKTWSRTVQISSVGGAYPCMTELQDGKIFISYSHFASTKPNWLYGQLLVVDQDGVRPADPVS